MAQFDNHFMEVNSLGDQQDTPVELLNCLECLNANTNGCTQRRVSAHLLISQHTEILPEQCYDNKYVVWSLSTLNKYIQHSCPASLSKCQR